MSLRGLLCKGGREEEKVDTNTLQEEMDKEKKYARTTKSKRKGRSGMRKSNIKKKNKKKTGMYHRVPCFSMSNFITNDNERKIETKKIQQWNDMIIFLLVFWSCGRFCVRVCVVVGVGKGGGEGKVIV